MTASASLHVVLADDLTGAVEVAATAQRFGIRSVVHMGNLLDAPLLETDILQVIDTESRLMADKAAAKQVLSCLLSLRSNELPFEIIFKKTDSALRGPITAELYALAKVLHKDRILLVPANPAAGRTIAGGVYTINGVELDQTNFARDPHHPALSARVVDLLARSGWPSAVSISHDMKELPDGLLIGDATTEADLSRWAASVDSSTLAAGSAAFFASLLKREHRPSTIHPKTEATDNILLISGTTDSSQKAELVRLGHSGQSLPDLLEAATQARAGNLVTHASGCRAVFLHLDCPVVPAEADTIRNAMADIAFAAVNRDQRLDLVIEGGATAAAIAESCGWSSFEMISEWAPGVVRLQPCGSEHIAITLKPGSYPWPPALRKRIHRRVKVPVSD